MNEPPRPPPSGREPSRPDAGRAEPERGEVSRAELPRAEPERWNVASLRRARPIRARGNFGTGVPCPMCRMILSTRDLVFEATAELDGHEVTINFHPRCYDRWKETAAKG